MSSKNEDQAITGKEEEALNAKQLKFIDGMLTHGDRRKAYFEAYPNCSLLSVNTCAKRLLNVPAVARQILAAQYRAKQVAFEALEQQYQGKLAAIDEKRAVLAQIIRGEIIVEKEVTAKDGTTRTIKIKSDPKERIRAIMLDNKMEEEWKQASRLPNERYILDYSHPH